MLSSKPVYADKWISVREDLVGLPDGRTTIYGVVTCGHCVGLLPFLDGNTVLLVRQYRYVAGRTTWEMPTGGVHAGESIEEAAQRELAEEIGYRAGRLTHVSSYHTSKSVMDETAVGEEMVKLALPLLVLGDVTFWIDRTQIADLAVKSRLPSMFAQREHVEAGGLIAYGADLRDNYRRATVYVDAKTMTALARIERRQMRVEFRNQRCRVGARRMFRSYDDCHV